MTPEPLNTNGRPPSTKPVVDGGEGYMKDCAHWVGVPFTDLDCWWWYTTGKPS